MQTFCTIITSSHLPLAKTLLDSLREQDPASQLHVLVTDNDSSGSAKDLHILSLRDVTGGPSFAAIEKKYAHTHPDVFRWALKPVLIACLLNKGYSKVIFTDPDVYFVGPYQFLFDLLEESSILLTPHWADLDVQNNPDSILSVMKGGLFNAGFIAANTRGLDAINWWAGMCSYRMEKNAAAGVYDDQKYLDLLPVHFENVHILKHQGCNLASWNIQTCKREMINGRLRINGRFEPVFIHFAKDTITNILNRNDALLKSYLDEYIASLRKQGFDLMKHLDELPGYDSSLYKIKHKIRFRTRLKRFFYKLAEKL